MQNIKITFIGHSTTLIESGENRFLTDPVFSKNIMHIKRRDELKFRPAELPELTAVLISHTHMDHLDLPSFNYIKTTVPIVVPDGSGYKISRFLPNPVIELSHWSHHDFGNGLKIGAIPVNHSSQVFCPCKSKYAAGYIIEFGTGNVYFAGDTGYNTHFRDIGNTYAIDLALLPISCYRPAFFMKKRHMDPVEAVQAFLDLKAKKMIPIHWGSFRLSFEKLDEPIEWLKKIATERNLEEQITVLSQGESVEI